jgi:aldose 1-epimerase
MDLALATADLGLVVTTTGGSVWRFFAKQSGREHPIFRDGPPGPDRVALQAGCFPFVPYGNRVRDSRFDYEGAHYTLAPNVSWDPHALHGDGWMGEWRLLQHDGRELRLGYAHRADRSPYDYTAEQVFTLDERTLTLGLIVTNTGDTALPFGLGWHPFFPLTPDTTLQAETRSFWDQDAVFLPTVERPTGGDLDFTAGAPLPRRWINTQFEGWDGRAAIRWPDRGLALQIEADRLFDRCVLFVSDPAVEPGYAYDHFCFEPMSHGIDGHNRLDGGLRRLAPGERLAGSVRFTVADLNETAAGAAWQ